MKHKIEVLGLLLFLNIALSQASYAYLDPGTGSMVVQIIVASIAAVGIFLKSFWGQIKSLFCKRQK